MERKDRQQREKDFLVIGEHSLRQHEIRKTESRPDGPFMWLVGKPGSSFYQATVVVAYDGSVIIHGDVNIVCFQSYRGLGGALEAIRWVALSDLSYLEAKAAVGTGQEVAYDYCDEVALDDVLDHIEQLEKEREDSDPESEKQIASWRLVEGSICDGDHEIEVRELVYEELNDPELAVHIGTVTSARVVWGWMIVRKLNELLCEI